MVANLQLGHVFPRPGAPLTEQVIVDLSQNPEELSAASGDTYPLIFRLETISDKGLTEGHVLEVKPLCSASQPEHHAGYLRWHIAVAVSPAAI